jgi:hypothetical protein
MLVHCFWVFGFKTWFEFKFVCLFLKKVLELEKKEKSKPPFGPAAVPAQCRSPVQPSLAAHPGLSPRVRASPPVADARAPLVSAFLPPPPRLRLGVERESDRRTIRSLGPRASASSATYLGAPPSRAAPHPYP